MDLDGGTERALSQWAPRWVLFGLLAVVAWSGWRLVHFLLTHQPAAIDLAPLWTAGGMALNSPQHIYDFAKITADQQWLLRGGWGIRPFAYPPSTLLLMTPLSTLSFSTAYAVWMLATGALMLWATMRLAPERPWLAAGLALVSTPAFLVLVTGQTTFLVAGLVALAVPALERRPRLAGVLLAAACLIKPTALILAPFALLAGRYWRALLWAGVAGLIGAAVTAAAFGPQPWLDWLEALPRFQALFDRHQGLQRGAIAPSAEAFTMGVRGLNLLIFRLGCVLVGIVVIWRVWSSTTDAPARIGSLLGGGLLAALYAMHYDAALLAPAVAVVVAQGFDGRSWIRAGLCIILMSCATVPHYGAYGLTGLVFVLAWPGLIPERSAFLRREPTMLTSS